MVLAIIVGAFLLCWLVMGVCVSLADNILNPKKAAMLAAMGFGGCGVVIMVAALLIFS